MADIIDIGTGDNGKAVTARVGDTISLRLDENPTTGYRWEVEPGGRDLVEPVSDTFELAAPPMIGSGGSRRLRFVARKPGQASLALNLRRSWEPDQPALKTFSVEITVLP